MLDLQYDVCFVVSYLSVDVESAACNMSHMSGLRCSDGVEDISVLLLNTKELVSIPTHWTFIL